MNIWINYFKYPRSKTSKFFRIDSKSYPVSGFSKSKIWYILRITFKKYVKLLYFKSGYGISRLERPSMP